MKTILLSLLALTAFTVAQAQRPSESDCRVQPCWIAMMDDPQVIYPDALHAFDLYWESHEKPVIENDLFGAEENEKDERVQQKRQQLLQSERKDMAYQYQRFCYWKEKMGSFVKEDGHLMNADERIRQWKQQMAGRK